MSKRVRVSLVRSGGVAGMRRTAALDTEGLDEERAGELRRLVEEADLVHISEPTIRASRDKDRFHYTLTVHLGEFQHSLTFAEEKTPDQLQPLIEMLLREGRGSPDDTQGVRS